MFGLIGGKKRFGKGGWIDPTESYQNYFSYIFRDHRVDVFIHSWSADFEKDIVNLYKPTDKLIEPQIDFSKYNLSNYDMSNVTSYLNIFKKRDDPIEYLKHLIFISHSRWYSTQKSIKLMQNYSKENKVSYDWVMQLRFDLHFFSPILFEQLNPNYFYSPINSNKEELEDLWFISNYENAIRFSSLYDHIFEYSIRPRRAAKQHLEKLSIKHRQYSFKRGRDFELTRDIQNLSLIQPISLRSRLQNNLIAILQIIINWISKSFINANKFLEALKRKQDY